MKFKEENENFQVYSKLHSKNFTVSNFLKFSVLSNSSSPRQPGEALKRFGIFGSFYGLVILVKTLRNFGVLFSNHVKIGEILKVCGPKEFLKHYFRIQSFGEKVKVSRFSNFQYFLSLQGPYKYFGIIFNFELQYRMNIENFWTFQFLCK